MSPTALLAGVGVNAWRWMLGVAAFPSLLYAVFCFGLPESPRWLLSRKGDREAGLQVLQRIEPDAFRKPKSQPRQTRFWPASSEQTVGNFWTMRLRKPILLAFLIAFFNQLSGINAILYFAPRIFRTDRPRRESRLLQSIGIGVTNLVFTFVGLWLIDRLGRRTLLYIGSFGYIASLGLVAWAFFTGHSHRAGLHLRFHRRARRRPGRGHLGVYLRDISQSPSRRRSDSRQFHPLDFAALLTTFLPPPKMVAAFRRVTCSRFFAGMMVLQLIWVK
jgi:MFS transporter, SP family, arabinose:H+ symporter